MSHEWHRGVLKASSWHGLEEVGVMCDSDAMIAKGEASGAWPVGVRYDDVMTRGGLVAPGKAIVASYAAHPETCLAVNGDRFTFTAPEAWRSLVKAAVAAGAKPTGCFALREGTRILATFEVGQSNGIRTHLMLADAFDGSMRLTCGTSSIKVVCANTMSAAMQQDGAGMAKLRHTASLETKINVLREGIQDAIKRGDEVKDAYHRAEETQLNRDQAHDVFDKLFPLAPEDATDNVKTRAMNARTEARRAMRNPLNDAGPTLATLWNAATFLVDREADGTARKSRGDALDSLLFGSRGRRVAEIAEVIQVVMKDGTVANMPVTEALARGVDQDAIGRDMLKDLLRD